MKCIPLLCQVLEEEPPWFCVMNRLRHRYLLRRRETGLIFLNNPNIHHACLALSWRRSLSYRNQSIDLLCKSIDWFLYHRDLRHERVKILFCSRLSWNYHIQRFLGFDKEFKNVFRTQSNIYDGFFFAESTILVVWWDCE